MDHSLDSCATQKIRQQGADRTATDNRDLTHGSSALGPVLLHANKLFPM